MSQLKELNSDISGKDRKIKAVYKTMKRVRVYFQVKVLDMESCEIIYETEELKSFKLAQKLYEAAITEYSGKTVRLYRIQTGGYVGGIILAGRCETLQTSDVTKRGTYV